MESGYDVLGFRGSKDLDCGPLAGGNTFLQIVGNHLPDYRLS
jgi:hypothetical protein